MNDLLYVKVITQVTYFISIQTCITTKSNFVYKHHLIIFWWILIISSRIHANPHLTGQSDLHSTTRHASYGHKQRRLLKVKDWSSASDNFVYIFSLHIQSCIQRYIHARKAYNPTLITRRIVTTSSIPVLRA
jgi:hypothetical protein